MKDYIFLDEAYLDMFFGQIKSSGSKKTNSSIEFGFPAGLKSLKYSRDNENREPNIYEKIEIIESHLKKGKNIEERRPFNKSYLADIKFLKEKFTAVKVVIPKSLVKEKIKIDEDLTVWISDPNPKDLLEDDFEGHGSFLYLTEKIFDKKGSTPMKSGWSALQALWNKANGEDFFKESCNEPLGRWNSDHPVEKLRKLGAEIGDTRELVSLYYKRYMTNEQAFISNGIRYRTNDILGYPLYIAAT